MTPDEFRAKSAWHDREKAELVYGPVKREEEQRESSTPIFIVVLLLAVLSWFGACEKIAVWWGGR